MKNEKEYGTEITTSELRKHYEFHSMHPKVFEQLLKEFMSQEHLKLLKFLAENYDLDMAGRFEEGIDDYINQ